MTPQSHDPKGVKMSISSKELGGYVGVNERLSEQKNLMSHVKCKQKGMNGKW